MAEQFNKKTSQLAGLISAAALSFAAMVAPVQAQETRTIVGEEYTPTIWIDPDGCEHWVFDDGFEGFMTSHRRPDGSAVCHRKEVCGIVPTDVLFATDEPWISASGKAQLMEFFQKAEAYGFLIYGHTDARASDEYNMNLSQRRADMVAGVAQSAGRLVVESRGFGERRPIAEGNAAPENRRVEIVCLK